MDLIVNGSPGKSGLQDYVLISQSLIKFKDDQFTLSGGKGIDNNGKAFTDQFGVIPFNQLFLWGSFEKVLFLLFAPGHFQAHYFPGPYPVIRQPSQERDNYIAPYIP